MNWRKVLAAGMLASAMIGAGAPAFAGDAVTAGDFFEKNGKIVDVIKTNKREDPCIRERGTKGACKFTTFDALNKGGWEWFAVVCLS